MVGFLDVGLYYHCCSLPSAQNRCNKVNLRSCLRFMLKGNSKDSLILDLSLGVESLWHPFFWAHGTDENKGVSFFLSATIILRIMSTGIIAPCKRLSSCLSKFLHSRSSNSDFTFARRVPLPLYHQVHICYA